MRPGLAVMEVAAVVVEAEEVEAMAVVDMEVAVEVGVVAMVRIEIWLCCKPHNLLIAL